MKLMNERNKFIFFLVAQLIVLSSGLHHEILKNWAKLFIVSSVNFKSKCILLTIQERKALTSYPFFIPVNCVFRQLEKLY